MARRRGQEGVADFQTLVVVVGPAADERAATEAVRQRVQAADELVIHVDVHSSVSKQDLVAVVVVVVGIGLLVVVINNISYLISENVTFANYYQYELLLLSLL